MDKTLRWNVVLLWKYADGSDLPMTPRIHISCSTSGHVRTCPGKSVVAKVEKQADGRGRVE